MATLRHLSTAAAFVALALTATLVGCDGGGGNARSPDATPSASTVPTVAATATPQPSPPGAITIDQPAEDSVVRHYLHVDGRTTSADGRLVVQVVDLVMPQIRCQQQVVASQRQSAAQGPQPAHWSAQLPIAVHTQTPNTVVQIRAFSLDPRDGSEQNLVTRNVRLAPEPPAITVTRPSCNASVPAGSMLRIEGNTRLAVPYTVELRGREEVIVAAQDALAENAALPGYWTTTFDLSALPGGGLGVEEVLAYSRNPSAGFIENGYGVPITVTP